MEPFEVLLIILLILGIIWMIGTAYDAIRDRKFYEMILKALEERGEEK